MKTRVSKKWLRDFAAKCDALTEKWKGINAAAKALGMDQAEYCDAFPERCR